MSEEKAIRLRRTQWVVSILLVAIPLCWQVRETKMDPLNILIMGAGVLWVATTAIREDWHYQSLNRIRTNRWFRIAVLIGIALFTAGLSYRAYASSAVGNSPGSTNVAGTHIDRSAFGDPNAQKAMDELKREVEDGNKKVIEMLRRGLSSVAAKEEYRLEQEYVGYAVIAIGENKKWIHTQYGSGRFEIDWDNIRVGIDSRRAIHLFIPSLRDLKYHTTVTNCAMSVGAIPGATVAGYGWAGVVSLQMECLAAGSDGVYVVLGIKERSKELPHK